ncbi:DUF3817 domain-containing protein [Jannaschia sp. R86511]|uniref:DUF3817 domain-containing protein n=1 Tax=Jannaschia sp. R86511 TaxID=3093853 RepID=UPI0036D2D8ED
MLPSLRDHLTTWPRHHRPHRLVLAWTAWAETATLVVLLVNVVTVHSELVTSTVGPVHGGLYLLCSAAVVAARWVRGWSWPLVLVGLLPAVGAVVALEALRREGARQPVGSSSTQA